MSDVRIPYLFPGGHYFVQLVKMRRREVRLLRSQFLKRLVQILHFLRRMPAVLGRAESAEPGPRHSEYDQLHHRIGDARFQVFFIPGRADRIAQFHQKMIGVSHSIQQKLSLQEFLSIHI